MIRSICAIAVLSLLLSTSIAKAASTGGYKTEVTFVDTPTYYLGFIFLFFLVISVAFERTVHFVIHHYKKKKRFGLVAATNALVLELTIVGFVSLLLTSFQDIIASTCVSYSPETYETWSMLSNVHGCDCCLENTKGVNACFEKGRECGIDFCNCGYPAESTCPAKIPTLDETLVQFVQNEECSQCSTAYGELLFNATDKYCQHDAKCDGLFPVFPDCPAGKTHLITLTTLHQVHIFIFIVAMTNVAMGILLIIISAWRVRLWRKWNEEEDMHAASVRNTLQESTGQLARGGSKTFHRRLNLNLARIGRRRQSLDDSATPGTAQSNGKQPARIHSAPAAASTIPQGGGAPDTSILATDSIDKESPIDNDDDSISRDVTIDFDTPAYGIAVADGNRQPSEILAGLNTEDADVNVSKTRRLLQSLSLRSKTFTSGWFGEITRCFFIQFFPQALTKEEFYIMRASFMLTHRVPESFDFLDYILQSMEDDLANIVGMGVEMWLTMLVLILISGPLGWTLLLFLAIAVVLHLCINTKLVQIVRHVSRGGKVNKLASNIFWFKKPDLLLPPIKFTVFLCSFTNASAIFFVWMYGPHSCYMSSTFWFAGAVPWWVSLVVSWIIFFDQAFKTIPLYSLCVQMGSDFKHSMLPTGLKRRLLQIAFHAKETVARQKELQAGDMEKSSTSNLVKLGLDKAKLGLDKLTK